MITEEKIKVLGEELRTFRKCITDEKTLIGFNMAVAICNKHLGENNKTLPKEEQEKIKENKTMKAFDIYFSDLTVDAQKRLMDAVGISSPSEENWDIDMCPIAIYEFESSDKDSRDTKRNNPIIINVSDTIPNIDVSDKINRRKRVDVTKLVL